MSISRLDIVLPSTGTHGWHLTEGWVEVARRTGCLGRVFRPTAAWGAPAPTDDDGLLDALLHDGVGAAILVLGLDWHSQALTSTETWRAAWHRTPATVMALVWEDHAASYLDQNPGLAHRMRAAATAMCACADIVFSHHEANTVLFQWLGSSDCRFLPFAIDPDIFFPGSVPFGQKDLRLFFRGKVDNLGLRPNPYAPRRALLEALRDELGADFFWHTDYVQEAEFASLMERHAFHLNPPSFSRSMTMRTMEALGSGGCLFQFYPTGEQTAVLFEDGQDLCYFDPGDAVGTATAFRALANNRSRAEEMAARGRERVLAAHTIAHRLDFMLDLCAPRRTRAGRQTPSARVEGVLQVEGALQDAPRRTCAGRQTLSARVEGVLQRLRWGSAASAAPLLSRSYAVAGQYAEAEAESLALLSRLGRINRQLDAAYVDYVQARRPRIIFDSAFFHLGRGGIARVWDSVLEEFVRLGLRDNVTVLDRADCYPNRWRFATLPMPAIDFNQSPATATAEIDRMIPEERPFLFLSSYFTTSSRGHNVQIVHDMIPELSGGCEPVWRHKAAALASARRLICVSHNTRRDLAACRPDLQQHSMRTLRNGLSRAVLRSRPSTDFPDAGLLKRTGVEPFRYFVFVGLMRGWRGYKNALVLLRALDLLRVRGILPADWRMVFIGGCGALDVELEPQISRSLLNHLLHIEADDRDYLGLLTAARALIYPSAYEGFGLPILEAFCCGCPVVCSSAASLPEVARDVAQYFNPFDHLSLADILHELMQAPDRPELRRVRQSYAFDTLTAWPLMARGILSGFLEEEEAVASTATVIGPHLGTAGPSHDLGRLLAKHYGQRHELG